MKKIFCFLLVISITGIISETGFCPEMTDIVNFPEIETISVKPIKVALPRPFFRLPAHQTKLWCMGLEKEVWVRNYIPKEDAETATGEKAKWGVIAVDPKKIPLGSIVLIPEFPGQKFIAEDTGDFSGWKIDLCRNPDYPLELAKKFGKKRMRITIINPIAG